MMFETSQYKTSPEDQLYKIIIKKSGKKYIIIFWFGSPVGVLESTETICRSYRKQSIHTTFQLNPGGHHDHPVERTAAGIGWMAKEPAGNL